MGKTTTNKAATNKAICTMNKNSKFGHYAINKNFELKDIHSFFLSTLNTLSLSKKVGDAINVTPYLANCENIAEFDKDNINNRILEKNIKAINEILAYFTLTAIDDNGKFFAMKYVKNGNRISSVTLYVINYDTAKTLYSYKKEVVKKEVSEFDKLLSYCTKNNIDIDTIKNVYETLQKENSNKVTKTA